jgi:hypothetical protein
MAFNILSIPAIVEGYNVVPSECTIVRTVGQVSVQL